LNTVIVTLNYIYNSPSYKLDIKPGDLKIYVLTSVKTLTVNLVMSCDAVFF